VDGQRHAPTGRKYSQNHLRQSCVNFWILFLISDLCCCESHFRFVTASISYFFRPSSSLIGSERSVVLDVKAFLTEESNWQLFCLHFYSLCLRFCKVSNVLWVSRMCCYFEVDQDRSGESPKKQEVYCWYRKLLPPQERRLYLQPRLP
jgi:hypothetical protein